MTQRSLDRGATWQRMQLSHEAAVLDTLQQVADRLERLLASGGELSEEETECAKALTEKLRGLVERCCGCATRTTEGEHEALRGAAWLLGEYRDKRLTTTASTSVIAPRSGRAEFDALLADSGSRLADTTAVGGKT